MCSISIRTLSPGKRVRGGFCAIPTPSGVPVRITSPGIRVNPGSGGKGVRLMDKARSR